MIPLTILGVLSVRKKCIYLWIQYISIPFLRWFIPSLQCFHLTAEVVCHYIIINKCLEHIEQRIHDLLVLMSVR